MTDNADIKTGKIDKRPFADRPETVRRSYWVSEEAASLIDQVHMTTGVSCSELVSSAIVQAYAGREWPTEELQQIQTLAARLPGILAAAAAGWAKGGKVS